VKYKVRTLFDITKTGVTGHFKSSRTQLPTQDTWDRARNQQRNFETIQQLLSLRTNIADVSVPTEIDGVWEFEFVTESDGVYGDDMSILREDAVGVPMINFLDNDPNIEPFLVVDGADQNIWFELIPINNILEN
jgi:hypothetical protein